MNRFRQELPFSGFLATASSTEPSMSPKSTFTSLSKNLLVPYAGVIEITHFEVKHKVKFYFQGKAGSEVRLWNRQIIILLKKCY